MQKTGTCGQYIPPEEAKRTAGWTGTRKRVTTPKPTDTADSSTPYKTALDT
jgi:hypothetical protein